MLCWGANCYLKIFSYLQEGTLFARLINGRPYTNDFILWYNAALLAAQCTAEQKINIYDPVIQNQGILALAKPVVPELNFFIQYPPQFFALVRPMAGLGLANAWGVWCLLSLIMILAGLWFLSKDLGESKFGRAFLFIAVLASFPAWISFELGQTALYQFPAFMAFWLLLRARRYFLAGLATFLLLVKLQYIPIIVITGLILGRLRYLAGLAVAGGTLAALTYWIVGWSNIVNYPQALIYGETSDKVSGVSAIEMQCLRGELVLIAGHEDKLIHLIVVACFGVAFLFLCALWIWIYPRLQKLMGLASNAAFEICAAVTIMLMLIASPHTHTQEFLGTTLSSVFLFHAFDLWKPANKHRWILRTLIVAFPILSWVFFIFRPVFKFIMIQPFFVWDLACLALVFLEVKGLFASNGGTQSETKSETNSETQTKTKSETNSETQTETQAETQSETQTQSQTQDPPPQNDNSKD